MHSIFEALDNGIITADLEDNKYKVTGTNLLARKVLKLNDFDKPESKNALDMATNNLTLKIFKEFKQVYSQNFETENKIDYNLSLLDILSVKQEIGQPYIFIVQESLIEE